MGMGHGIPFIVSLDTKEFTQMSNISVSNYSWIFTRNINFGKKYKFDAIENSTNYYLAKYMDVN